jgi:hypothetical protein
MRILLALALCAGAVAAGDLTGKWNGTAEIAAPDGRAVSRPALLALVQNGTSLTGKMGPDEQRMQPVQNAKLEGNALTFDSPMGPDRTAKAALTIVDEKTMEGTIEGTTHTGEAFKAKVKFVRVAASGK